MLFLLTKISVIIIFLRYMLCSLPIAPFVYSLIPKFIYLLWRNVFQIAIYYFHFFFCIMLRSDYIPKIIKIDQVLHPFFYLMQYYIISYFLKKFTFINTEVEIANLCNVLQTKNDGQCFLTAAAPMDYFCISLYSLIPVSTVNAT